MYFPPPLLLKGENFNLFYFISYHMTYHWKGVGYYPEILRCFEEVLMLSLAQNGDLSNLTSCLTLTGEHFGLGLWELSGPLAFQAVCMSGVLLHNICKISTSKILQKGAPKNSHNLCFLWSGSLIPVLSLCQKCGV